MPGIFKLLSIALFMGAVLPSCSPGTKPVKESYSGILPGIKVPARLSYAGTGGHSAVTTDGLLVEYFKSGDANADFFVKGKRGWEFNAFHFASQPGSSGVKSFQYAQMVPFVKIKPPDFKSLTGKHRALILDKPVPSISR